ncbi:unnamed protein product [Hydatigera taeniaeformis]|uniref:TPT domain-containing protein n=1 Tax=Hydatigena taeniaeformis TaxID=6205 RepID=A0A0R3XCI5_HYDTA|nr:unnamed protein product [Hydatigera taeniaeformis]
MFMLTASYIQTSMSSFFFIVLVKTSVPIFIVVFSCCLGKRYSFKTYVSLFIILFGVMITSKTEVSLTLHGLLIGLLSAMGSAAFSLYMKMVLTSSSLNASNVLLVVSGASVLCILPIWSFVDLRSIIYTDKGQLLEQLKKGGYLSLLDGVARCSQNYLAVVMLSRLTALSYSVASVVKRLLVILTAIVFFATPASAVTFVGLGLATVGLLLYNLVRISSLILFLFASQYFRIYTNAHVMAKKQFVNRVMYAAIKLTSFCPIQISLFEFQFQKRLNKRQVPVGALQ